MTQNITPEVINLSNNQDIDGILWGWRWGNGTPQNLTFSFPTGTAEYTGYQSITNFAAFTTAQQDAVCRILTNAASFCNLTFTETTNAGATLRYAVASSINYTNDNSVARNIGDHTVGLDPGTAEANPPELPFNGTAPYSPNYSQGDSWYYPDRYNNPEVGSFQYAAGIMHETGHNLGLKHGHVTQNGHGVNFPTLPADHDSYEYSVMTYRQFPGDNPTNGDNAVDHPTTFMQNDIAALQYMYGANYGPTANNGDTTYTWSTTSGEASINGVRQGAPYRNFVFMTVWDGGGNDTYDFSDYTTNLSVELNPGEWIILDTSTNQFQRANLGNNGDGGPTYFARGNIANALVDPNNPTETASLIENAKGGSGNDTFKGNQLNNTFTGGGGNDTIDGGAGNDTASYITATSGVAASLEQKLGWLGDATGDQFISIENLEGSNYDDFLIGDNGANILSGLAGNDTLEGRDGDDTLNGGEGNNILNAGEGNNTINAGSGNDTVYAGAGNDNIFTDGGDDQIYAGNGNNSINAGDGNNKIYAGTGYDYISAGAGDDEIYADNGGSTIFAGAGNNKVYTGTGYDSVYAEDGDDLISVGDGGSTIRAGNGKNTIYAGTGDDEVYTGTSDDEIYVGEGNNYINAGDGNNTVSTGAGSDVIDTGAADDTIYAGEGLNTVRAGDGNNKIYSGASSDFIFAGNGNDLIYAGEGQNYIDAAAGNNTIYSGASSDIILVGNGNDLIYAGEGNNRISAGDGNNTIYTGAGSDEISTGSGNDLIYAGEGNNLIATGTGFDTVYAGSGFDRFSLSEGLGEVTIIGFQVSQDSFIGTGPLSFSISGNDTFVSLSSSSDLLAIAKDVQLV